MIEPLKVIEAYGDVRLTLPDMLKARVDRHADKILLRFGTREWSYAEFDRQTDALAAAFAARGVARGDRVAVVGRNHPAHMLTLFALAKLGGLMVPINPEFGVSELAYILGHAQVTGVILPDTLEARVGSACKEAGIEPFFLFTGSSEPGLSFEEALENHEDYTPPGPVSSQDPCLIIYTSGTTGRPKGVVHSHENFLRCGQINIARLRLQPDDVVMIVLPFFHVNALFYSAAGAFCAGATIFAVERFSASSFWRQAADAGATTVNIIEAIGNILLARDRSEFRPDNVIRAIYGVRPRYESAFREAFNIPQIVSGYGLTEIPGVTCGSLDAPNKEHSMGRVLEHPDPEMEWARCRIIDDEGRDVAEGQEGELLIKSPAMMLHYFRDPEATRKAVTDGWFATGDIVRRDADGEYFFVSRKKDIIRRRGENISGAELDIVIGAHPDVLEAAAIAVPSELGEDDILVVVVPHEGKQLSATDIAQWCADRLAPMKIPRFVAFATKLPHTATHKIAKAVLRADPDLRARAQEIDITTLKRASA
ncbi:AMP-binding protein [Pelagibacterium sp.]|uniref:AMP-binding protein n=1 Tax=Pelagibacterium sp. TaxID=1967288 RepID=UPI003A9448CA